MHLLEVQKFRTLTSVLAHGLSGPGVSQTPAARRPVMSRILHCSAGRETQTCIRLGVRFVQRDCLLLGLSVSVAACTYL